MERLWKSDLNDGTFQNPVLFADYSDPDVIRVGDTYYMTASSFNYVPGLPILTSKDLVNWKLVNYAIDRIDYENYNVPQHAKGVWAPAIRYHEGAFYIYYGMPDEGIFMVKTTDPLGKWEKPVLVLEGKGLIDSCPIWDEDGRAYVIHGYAKSRIGFKSFLGIFEMSWDGTKAISEDHILYDGLKTQHTIEGPKIYKRDGFYYILAPAGGVKTGWQTALRSKNIHGPYEEMVVLRQGNTEINGPHQGALVDTTSGEEWFVHFQDRGLYGRITHLQPVTWIDGWPAMGCNIKGYCGEPVINWKKPDTGCEEESCYLEASDDFISETLNLMWQWLGNAGEDFYSLTKKEQLRLYSKNPSGREKPTIWECSNVLTQKLVCPYFEAECLLDAGALMHNEKAGMVMMGGDYAYLAVKKEEDEYRIVYTVSHDEKGTKVEEEQVIAKICDASCVKFLIKMQEGPSFQMYYQVGSEGWTEVKEAQAFVPSDHTWVGAKLGLFSIAGTQDNTCGYADFSYIHVKAIEKIPFLKSVPE